MASFITALFTSIFTPGPTPVLLFATNISFGALQLVLAILLIATHSVHFLILSILSGGLWWAINWFAAEIRAVEAVKKRKDDTEVDRDREGKEERGMTTDDDDEGETEEEDERRDPSDGDRGVERRDGTTERERDEEHGSGGGGAFSSETGSSGAGSEMLISPMMSEGEGTGIGIRGTTEGVRRRKSVGDGAGDLSTDSEWDKVSEEGDMDR
jgi:hypothetical protein